MTGVTEAVIDGRPETLMKTIDDSLRNLRTDFIDLYYLHRWDKSVPIEDSVVRLRAWLTRARLVPLGYRRYLSELCERTCRSSHCRGSNGILALDTKSRTRCARCVPDLSALWPLALLAVGS